MKKEASEVVKKGKLWADFWGTDWGKDLKQFFEEQEKLGREATSDLVMAGQYEEAKAAGHKTSGIISVKNYIEDAISSMKQELETERTPEPSEAEIPNHVRTHH